MSMTKFLQEAKRLEIQPYRKKANIEELKRKSIAFIGSPLSLVPGRFQARMEAADMIVAKGQGNYETIDDFPGDVFLILRAKCHIIADHMGVQFGQVGLISTRAR